MLWALLPRNYVPLSQRILEFAVFRHICLLTNAINPLKTNLDSELRDGQMAVPSKYPHNPFASMESWKHLANTVQFKLSFRTKEGRMSMVIYAVVDIG
jgi:hypothetical protein